MRRMSIVAVGSLVLAAGVLVAVGSPVAADCANFPEAAKPAQARGTTFIGVVDDYVIGRGDDDSVITWRVEKVYNGAPLPRTLSFHSPPCVTVALDVGERYLFSTSRIQRPRQGNSLAWTLGQGDAVTLWSFKESPRKYPRSTREIDTLTEALDAVAPYWDVALPPTDTAVAGPGSGALPSFVVMVSATAAAVVAVWWRFVDTQTD